MDSVKTERKNDNATVLSTGPIGQLLWKFTLPAAVGVIVSALYNIIDKIFVGKGVGEIAFGSLSIASSFMFIITAVSMLFGMGAANLISVKLGQRKPEEAKSALTHGFMLQLISSVVITAAGLIFLEPLLKLFGAQPGTASMDYAMDYMRVILYGTIPNMVSFGFSHGTRAQGFKGATMFIMIVGAAVNLILDPLFIFVFKWGVEGAAWATVIAQIISMLVGLYYAVLKKGAIHISLKGFRFVKNTISLIFRFGLSQFAVQFAVSIITAVYNYSLMKYGPAYFGLPEGGDIALAGFNVMITIQQLALMPIMGITQGAQPILGFNYGAKNYRRVRKTIQYAALAATVICVLGFLLIQLFPSQVASLFSSDMPADFMDFAILVMRSAMICMPLVGFQIVSANYFTVIGKTVHSLTLTLSRQCLLLVPLVFILSGLMGLEGIIIAPPIADGIAFLITGALVTKEVRGLKKAERVMETAK